MRRLLLVLAMLGPPQVQACSVPVFRFALERWKPEPFAVVKEGDRAEVRYPDSEEGDPPLWSGPASRADDAKRSPARAELVRLLASGESAVWILLECGDTRADRAAEQLLRAELARLLGELKLPPEKDTRDDLLSSLELRLSFAVLKVRRDDPAEAVLVKQLLDLDEGLQTAKGPILFPVFGRGRAFRALVGGGISADEIAAAGKFLCGACFCSVKDDCPGKDLLLDADWPRLLRLDDETERPAPVIAPGVREEPEAVPAAPTQPGWLVAGAAVLCVLLLAAWWLSRQE